MTDSMTWFKDTLTIQTRGKGLYAFTEQVTRRIQQWQVQEGMCTLFCQHTSASLLISENYDPTAKADLETFLEKLAPENQAWYQHTLEGPDELVFAPARDADAGFVEHPNR